MLTEKLQRGKVITLEVLLPITSNIDGVLKEIELLRDYIDAINIPSNPLGKLRPDALCYAHILQMQTGIETIPHFVARHLTLLGFESQLLGAAALGIENILCVTGDSPVEGRSTFELNSVKLLEIARNLGNGVTTSRKTIEPIKFCLCTSFNPNIPNLTGEFVKAAEKCRCGAQVFFTQAIFKPEKFLNILKELRQRHKDIKVIAGLSYLHTKKRAFSLMKFLGIPYDYINLVEERDETEMLLETAKKLKDHVDGFYVIPITKYSRARELIEKMRRIL
jgi:methylenetetrahydrofolate reductase (NADPH)